MVFIPGVSWLVLRGTCKEAVAESRPLSRSQVRALLQVVWTVDRVSTWQIVFSEERPTSSTIRVIYLRHSNLARLRDRGSHSIGFGTSSVHSLA